MTAAVIPFIPTDAAVEAAWEAYEAARREAEALQDDPRTTARQRMDASMRAIRAYRRFEKLVARLGSEQ